MSLKAMIWVMEDAPVENQAELAILYALADRADDKGEAAYPAQEWIAHRARCDARTVRRHIKRLEERGIIKRGNPRFVEHIRKDVRPIVWDLNLHLKEGLTTGQERPDNMTARSNGAERPDNSCTTTGQMVQNDRTALSYKPSLTVLNRPEPLSSIDIEPGSFDEFYTAYPRKGDKRKAEEKWGVAILDTDPSTIIEAAKKYREEKTGVSRNYVKLPSTWLNQRCWEDYAEVSVIDEILGKEPFDDGRF